MGGASGGMFGRIRSVTPAERLRGSSVKGIGLVAESTACNLRCDVIGFRDVKSKDSCHWEQVTTITPFYPAKPRNGWRRRLTDLSRGSESSRDGGRNVKFLRFWWRPVVGKGKGEAGVRGKELKGQKNHTGRKEVANKAEKVA